MLNRRSLRTYLINEYISISAVLITKINTTTWLGTLFHDYMSNKYNIDLLGYSKSQLISFKDSSYTMAVLFGHETIPTRVRISA